MKLTVTQENLTRALATVGRVASSKTSLPVLNNILLRTEKNRRRQGQPRGSYHPPCSSSG